MRHREISGMRLGILGVFGCLAFLSASPLDTLNHFVLRPNGIGPADLDLRLSEEKPDAFRLSRVQALLENPLRAAEIISEVKALRPPVKEDTLSLPTSPAGLWKLLDIHAGEKAPADSLRASSDSSQITVEILLRELEAIRREMQAFIAPLKPKERDSLLARAAELFLMDESDTSRSPIEAELDRLRLENRRQWVFAVAGRLDFRTLARAGQRAYELQGRLGEKVRRDGIQWLKGVKETPIGPLTLGDDGPNRHVVGRGIFIDTGGDDEYLFSGESGPGDVTLLIDLRGRDRYISDDSLPQGPGHLGIFLSHDMQGDDTYLGRNFAWGSALFGYSHLHDVAGNDQYIARLGAQGFGFFGLGMLEDEAGNDLYSAGLFSQGASSSGGMGFLRDGSGQDQYIARPAFLDDLRYRDRNLSMSQGFSTGFRPHHSGGVAVLWDRQGNDVYVSDIYGQGAAYWYSLGVLLDEAGNDRYQAFQYAQGAGVHMAVGIAWDETGDDHRFSKGVSQGCGHDLGLGVLYDGEGDDSYVATDMSMGAGSANGIGILFDGTGKDAYLGLNPTMTLGHADWRRDKGSFGFFFDGEGDDHYSSSLPNGRGWRVFGGKVKGNGLGLDRAGRRKSAAGSDN